MYNVLNVSLQVPCVGVSIGIERLFSIMEAKAAAAPKKMRTTETEVYVIAAQKKLEDEKLKLVCALWDADVKTELNYRKNKKMLDQFQYCEEEGIPLAVIIGLSELEAGMVKMRVISTREEVGLLFLLNVL